jgi:DNA polymerase-1
LGPGQKEDARGEPFIGPAGETARGWLIAAGFHPKKDVYWANSTRCIGPKAKEDKEREPTPEEVRNCRSFLMDELEWVDPDLIVPAGGIALENLYNEAKFEGGKPLPITRLRGAVLWQEELGKKMVPILHPASAFHVWSNEKYGIADLQKALKESKQPDVFEEGLGKYQVCLDVESVEHLAELVETEAGVLSIDTETTSLDWQTGNILCVGVTWQVGTAYVVPVLGLGAEEMWSPADKKRVIRALRRIFQSDVPKIGQNIRFDELYLAHDLEIYLKNISFDTMLAYHLINEEAGHSLEILCNLYTNMGDYGRGAAEYKTHMADCPLAILWKYQGGDADCTLRVALEIDKDFDANPKRRWLFENVTMPLSGATMHMEEHGVLVDQEKADALVETYDRLVAEQKALLDDIPEVPEKFNYRSDQQKRKLLFGKPSEGGLGLEPSGILTDKARLPSVKKEALEEVGVGSHPIVPILIRLAGLEQIMKTFLKGAKPEQREKAKKGLLNKISKVDGRLHTNYRVDGTETGRLSASPNIQNVVGEGKSEEGAPIREIFIAPPGRVLLSADFSQIELRGLAYIAEDERLIGVLESGADVHDFVARKLFEVPDGTQVTKEQRRQAKTFNFGLGYGMSEVTIAKRLGCSRERAAELLDMYFGIVEKLPDYFAKQRRTVRNRHEVYNIFDRRRLFWGVETMKHFGGYKKQMGHVYRESYNFPVQSSASDIHSLATIRLDRDQWLCDNEAWIVASIHDSVMMEVAVEKAEEVARYVQKVMQDSAYEETARVGRPWIVPVDVEWGSAWEDVSHHLTKGAQVHEGAPDKCRPCEEEEKVAA